MNATPKADLGENPGVRAACSAPLPPRQREPGHPSGRYLGGAGSESSSAELSELAEERWLRKLSAVEGEGGSAPGCPQTSHLPQAQTQPSKALCHPQDPPTHLPPNLLVPSLRSQLPHIPDELRPRVLPGPSAGGPRERARPQLGGRAPVPHRTCRCLGWGEGVEKGVSAASAPNAVGSGVGWGEAAAESRAGGEGTYARSSASCCLRSLARTKAVGSKRGGRAPVGGQGVRLLAPPSSWHPPTSPRTPVPPPSTHLWVRGTGGAGCRGSPQS